MQIWERKLSMSNAHESLGGLTPAKFVVRHGTVCSGASTNH